MGTAITPELLNKIQSKKITNSTNKIIEENEISKIDNKSNFKEILNNIYSSYYNKEQKNEIINSEDKNDENRKIEIDLNDIIIQRHKSFDSSYNLYKKFDNLNYIFEKGYNENLSENDNESIISDYVDISNEIKNFNKNKKKENNKDKEMEMKAKKIRDA